ncbi:MAG: Na/Pi cotransporter family protein [Candidatus Cloacimonadales bacterium]|nr:Na/Pi cotransporter family protein [Candidatus Cloacimonadales bacterium]
MDVIVTIFKLLGSLGMFLYGMRVMSEGVQKAAGEKLQRILGYMTSNRVVAVLTGFIITGIIQSSSATTVMVISFVNASLLTLTQAIGVIMGANIGTTVTTWIVSFFGFKFNITAIALPIIGIGFPLYFSKREKRKEFGEILVGFGLLFMGLAFLKSSVPAINEEGLAFLQKYTDLGFLSFVIFVFVGAILTAIVQSSSAATAITVTMAFMGWIDLETSAAIVLGENIGTTITAYLASIGTSVNARRAARAHFLFNTIGVILMAFVFKYFINAVIYIAPWDTDLQENLPLTLALFHTAFNLCNTLIFICFVRRFADLIIKIVPEKASDKPRTYKLQYFSTGLQDTALLNILNAKNEILKMVELAQDMFSKYLKVFFNPQQDMSQIVKEVKQMEELADLMQSEISKYLVECTKEELSEISRTNVNAMLRTVHEIESISDSCFKLILLTQRRYRKNLTLHKKSDVEIQDYAEIITDFIKFFKKNINKHLDSEGLEIAYNFENTINEYRNKLKKATQKRLQEGADVYSELLYLDILKNFEHIGDNSLNIAQALRQIR